LWTGVSGSWVILSGQYLTELLSRNDYRVAKHSPETLRGWSNIHEDGARIT